MIYLFLSLNLVIVLGSFYLLYDSLKPMRDLAAANEEWLALLTETAETCRGQAKLMELVEGIAFQFKTDDGLSMKDTINRIETAAKKQSDIADVLETNIREDRMKAELDRDQLQQILVEQHRALIKVETAINALSRIEGAANAVASDLAAAQERADAVTDSEPGAAADAGAQSAKKGQGNG